MDPSEETTQSTALIQSPAEPMVEGITFRPFQNNGEILEFKKLNDSILSEAYSLYTYHYFVCTVPEITYTVISTLYLTTRHGMKKGR